MINAVANCQKLDMEINNMIGKSRRKWVWRI